MKKKLNILQILPSLESGGVERGALEIAKYLVEQGHKSYVISSGGRLVSKLQEEGSIHHNMNIGKKSIITLFIVPRLIKFIKQHKIHIVHVRSRLPAWITYIALFFISKNKPRFITTVHGYNSVSLYSKIMTKGDTVIVVSKFIKEYIVRTYKINQNKVKLIYRGVPENLKKLNINKFNLWKKNFEKEIPQLLNNKVLTISARISKTKGIDIFIDLISNLISIEKNIHGLIVGEAKSESYLKFIEKKIKKLNLENKISIVGYRKDIYNIIQYSDITFCLSRVPEPFGRGVIESIKLGTPVIGFDYGGSGEQLKEIFPIGLVKHNNFDQLLEKTKLFLINKPVVEKTKKFTLEEMQQKTLKIYENFY